MSETLNLHQRMLGVMKAISFVQKTEKQGFMYKFVTHDAVTALCRGAMIEQGIVTTADVTKHIQDGNRTEVDVRVTFINVDAPADRIEVNAFGYGIDPQDKGPGKAISYAVKYAYLKAFALEAGDDPERDSIDHKPAKANVPGLTSGNDEGKAVLAGMSTEEADFIRSHADALAKLFRAKDYTGMVAYVQDEAKLDGDETLALWTLMPSDMRREFKKAKAAMTSPLAA